MKYHFKSWWYFVRMLRKNFIRVYFIQVYFMLLRSSVLQSVFWCLVLFCVIIPIFCSLSYIWSKLHMLFFALLFYSVAFDRTCYYSTSNRTDRVFRDLICPLLLERYPISGHYNRLLKQILQDSKHRRNRSKMGWSLVDWFSDCLFSCFIWCIPNFDFAKGATGIS